MSELKEQLVSGPKEPSVAGSSTSGRAVRPFRPLVLLAVASLVAAACNAGASASSPPASAGASASASAAVSAAPSIDPLAPYPSKSGTLPTVTFAQSVPAVIFAPAIIARDMNFFEYQGVKLQFITLQSDATALMAITSGSIDLDNDSSTTIAGAVAQGLDFQAIQNTIGMTIEVCVRKDWAQQHNVTASSPLAERLAALKGATIAITGPGAISDRAMRYLLTKYGNLNPDTDTKITSIAFSAEPAALDANQVQAFTLSPPLCGQTKNGMSLIRAAEIPGWQGSANQVLFAPRAWLTAHKPIAAAAATAISMGDNFILKYPAAALKLLDKDFPAVDPQVMADAFNGVILPATTADGKFTASMWQVDSAWLLDAGLIKAPLPTTEGTIWTNEYIGDATVK